MEITWYGHSCFRIVERRYASIVTDPFDYQVVGYAPLKLAADVVTVSHRAPGHSHTAAVRRVRQLLTGPGEYEIGGVFITAIQNGSRPNGQRNTVYVFDFEKIRLAHLGDLNTLPGKAQIEAIGEVHVLFLPVGGGKALNAAQAAEVVSLLEPALVVPMHYATPACRLPLDSLDKFLKEMGVSAPEKQPSLKVTAADFRGENGQTQVVVLDYARG